MRLFSFSAAALGLAALVRASNVVTLTSANFDEHVGGDKGALVEFFAPWCGHCKNLAPIYEQLADAYAGKNVVIAQVDADGDGRDLGQRFEVKGFPTLKWFPAGSQEPEEYNAGRDLDSLAGFVTEHSGVKSNIKPPPPPAAKELDADNFHKIVDGSKNVLVAFTAPWCGHCKNMKPAYENVARAFENEDEVVIAHVNADAAHNKDLAASYDVRSFPTIKFFKKGSKEPIAYQSGRSEEQFTDFINAEAGTHRTPTGVLDDIAGTIGDLDKLAYQYYKELPSREKVATEVQGYITNLTKDTNVKVKNAAEYYLKAMTRIKEKGDAWVEKEANRLTNLLASSKLAPRKLDELKIKVNILGSFVKLRAEEAADAVEDAAAKVKEAIKDEL